MSWTSRERGVGNATERGKKVLAFPKGSSVLFGALIMRGEMVARWTSKLVLAECILFGVACTSMLGKDLLEMIGGEDAELHNEFSTSS